MVEKQEVKLSMKQRQKGLVFVFGYLHAGGFYTEAVAELIPARIPLP